MYKSLIRSIIDYGVKVYHQVTKKNTQLIENIQRRATRIPEKISYKQILETLNLSTLLYRGQKYDMIQIF